jgi:predicted lipid-binding transport protein (Tim44 family)
MAEQEPLYKTLIPVGTLFVTTGALMNTVLIGTGVIAASLMAPVILGLIGITLIAIIASIIYDRCKKPAPEEKKPAAKEGEKSSDGRAHDSALESSKARIPNVEMSGASVQAPRDRVLGDSQE